MNLTLLLAIAVLIAGGAMLAIQAPINAVLGRAMGDALPAAVASFAIGLVALVAATFIRGSWPRPESLGGLPWWAWTGGLFGAFYMVAVIWSVPKLGAVTTIVALVAGQLLAALVLDAVGAFGLPLHTISWTRIAAVMLVLSGLALSRLG